MLGRGLRGSASVELSVWWRTVPAPARRAIEKREWMSMNGHDYVAALAEEYRNVSGLGDKDRAAEVLAEIARVADPVGDNEWVPKHGLRDDLTVDADPADVPETAPVAETPPPADV